MKKEFENPALKKMQDAKAKVEAAKLESHLKMARAFETVFGHEGKRTAAQKIVLEHMKICAGVNNAFEFNGPYDGVKTALAAAHRDGASSQLRLIDYYLRAATTKK